MKYTDRMKTGERKMYLLTYASGYHEYYAISENIDKAAHEIIYRFNSNCYRELHTIEDLAMENESIFVYEIGNELCFDDDWNGLKEPKFDYLEMIRQAEVIEGSAFIYFLIEEKNSVKILCENDYFLFDTRKEAIEFLKEFD